MAYLRYQYKSAALCRNTTLDIYLPGSVYKQVEPPFKTLYFLPGYSADSTSIITYLRLRRHVELKGIAIVIPNSDNSFYVDHPERGTNYAAFAGKEIVEETRKYLPLSHRREDTFIGGISMGGAGSIVNGIRYSETFGKIAALSPAINFYDMLNEAPGSGFNRDLLDNVFGSEEEFLKSDDCAEHLYLDKGDEWKKYPELFLACGTDDELVYAQNKRLAERMKASGIPFEYRPDEGAHEFDFWERMLDPMFSFLAGIPENSANDVRMR